MYKSTMLLVEAIHAGMDKMRKHLMVNLSESTMSDVAIANGDAIDTLNELRTLFDELAAVADRPALADVVKLSPADYVASMKPLVAHYHRLLAQNDKLAPALCEDLSAAAAVLILIGDDKTRIHTAHDPEHAQVALVVDTLLAAIDTATKQVVEAGSEMAREAVDTSGGS